MCWEAELGLILFGLGILGLLVENINWHRFTFKKRSK